KAILVFFISLIAMLLFAAATQGYFICRSRKWESAMLLVIAFMLFRPDFLLDQVQDKYRVMTGPETVTMLDAAADAEDIRLVIEGPDFDNTGIRRTTIVVPGVAGDGAGALDAQGLTTLIDGDKVVLEEPFPGTPFFESLGNEYDFYGDTPVTLVQAELENDRMPKELFFIPALILLLGVVLIQRPRATQPAF
ncbi:MAG: DUF3394 domain-containing protein, partial [Pseudomonadota bacterium]